MQPAPDVTWSKLALVRLPVRMRRALRFFRKVTGLTAVTSIATAFPQPRRKVSLSPPVHPQCARRLRSTGSTPYSEQWLVHLGPGRRFAGSRGPICPLGTRCSCVPVHLGNQLVGVVKLIADSEIPDTTFSSAMGILRLAVSETAQHSIVSVLSGEVRALRQRVAEFQEIHGRGHPGAAVSDGSYSRRGLDEADAQGAVLVQRALSYLQRHYQERAVSLPAVAEALGCNPKYLTTCFTRIVGEHMHTHLLELRIAHVCRLLVGTDLRVKEIAYASGFSGAGRLAGVFRQHVGVSPGKYRRIFAGP